MKRPNKKNVQLLRLALGMSGVTMVNDRGAEHILLTQSEIRRLGSKFSLDDGVNLESFLKTQWEIEDKTTTKR